MTYTPGHPLHGMTQAKWDAMTPAQRDAARDTSGLHPKLIGLEGKRVVVGPWRGEGRRSKFIVGRTTGWRPAHLAMRKGARGSSDLVSPEENLEVLAVTPA